MKITIPDHLRSGDFLVKPTVLVIIISACFAFWFVDFWKPYNTAKKQNNFVYDVFNYYSYLPATFCNGGSFDWPDQFANYNPFGPYHTHLPKTTYGMSVMYAPFFALGYKIAYNQKSPMDGFSEPFATCIRWGSIFYVLLGMIFLRKFLLFYFDEMVTAIVLFSALFGTMLFIYTFNQSEMSHGYLFCLFSAFLLLTRQWHEKQSWRNTILTGAVIGLISLIRPTEVFIFIFFLLWNVRGIEELKLKVKFFAGKYLHFILFAVIGFLIWLPQFLFWKHHTGHYIYNSYPGEGFFWSDPQIANILFSYRKGWITYTPLVVAAFAGIFFVRKDFPISKWTFVFVICLTVYVLSCWWNWVFGGCFGARGFCQHIAFLSIPLAFFVNFVLNSSKKFMLKGVVRLAGIVFVISCVCLNLGQSYQYHNFRIHPSAMTRKIYWDVFRTYQYDDDYQYQYWRDIYEPNLDDFLNGKNRSQ